MPKIDLTDIQSLTNEQSAIASINANYATIESESDTFLSRDGTSPNHMLADLDMNSNRIINLPAPVSDHEAARYGDISAAVVAGEEAEESAASALASATAAMSAQISAETAKTAAETAQASAESAKTSAETAETNAETAATNAASSASAASTSASNAATSASTASTQATNASNSATAAAGSASTASTHATNAATSASTASTQASNASTSASNAAGSASTASTHASNASTSASNASTSATNASNSATAAATSATTAANNASVIAGVRWVYETSTTMAAPAVGGIRFNNATASAVTAIAVSAQTSDTGNPDISDFITTWDDSTNTNKGVLVYKKIGTPATFRVYNITAVVDNTTWLQLTVSHSASNGTLSASDGLTCQFERAGDKGSDGTGVGDVTGPVSSVDSEIALFSGTTGKSIKRATTTGILKASSGVIAAAVSGTDYAPATSGSSILKGNGTGGTTSATAGTDYYNPGGTDVAVADGGTGASTAATARTNLGAAPAAAKYIVQTTDTELSAEQALGALATGILKNTTTTGVLSIATAATDYVAPGTATNFTAQQYFGLATITDGANLSWTVSTGQKAKVTLGGNRTMNAVTGAVEGATYILWVLQDATGSRTITWTTTGAGSFDFGAEGAPTLTTTASRGDLIAFEAITIAGTLKLRYAGIRKGFA